MQDGERGNFPPFIEKRFRISSLKELMSLVCPGEVEFTPFSSKHKPCLSVSLAFHQKTSLKEYQTGRIWYWLFVSLLLEFDIRTLGWCFISTRRYYATADATHAGCIWHLITNPRCLYWHLARSCIFCFIKWKIPHICRVKEFAGVYMHRRSQIPMTHCAQYFFFPVGYIPHSRGELIFEHLN